MRRLSAEELTELGTRIGVELYDSERLTRVQEVNELLEGLETVDAVPVTAAEPGSTRSWHEPEDDPYGVIRCYCDVPPAESATGELAGVEIGLKDIIAVAGVPMHCGSEVMNGFVPGADATVVKRLRAAGATITAKLRLDEFAGSARGTTGSGPPIRNPYDRERTAGGSSGGSAAAVALDLVDAALGTDTGGSVRIPAAFCGVIGLKPTHGLVPLTGVVENTYTQDHVGVFAHTVSETAAVLDAIAGKDTHDPASLQAAGRDGYRSGGYRTALDDDERDEISIGVIDEGFGEGVTDAVADRTREAVDQLEDAGASIHHVSIEHFHTGKAVKNVLSFTELAAHWRDGGAPYRRGGLVNEGYQTALTRRVRASNRELDGFYKSKLLAGAYLMEGDGGRRYTRAQAVREVLRREVVDALEPVDVLLLPTMPDVAPPITEASDPGFDYARNTRLANVTRQPAITIPNGTLAGLPVGLQLVGTAFDERGLLSVAASVESILDSEEGKQACE